MTEIIQLRYGADNLGYVVVAGDRALAVDGGAVEDIVSCLSSRGLRLAGIASTHDHADHTSGNLALARRTGAPILDHRELSRSGAFELGGEAILVLPTPGHTMDGVVYLGGGAALTGDTLFNATVGNCFSGDLEAFYRSINRLLALPPETRIYAGHDYFLDSLRTAQRLEPQNAHREAYRAAYDPGHVVSTLADELRVNPYLRFNEPSLVNRLADFGLPRATSLERWVSLMTLE